MTFGWNGTNRDMKQIHYRYWHTKPRNGFSHHELEVRLRHDYDVKSWHDESLFHLRAQCDDDKGHSMFRSYAMKAEIPLDGEVDETLRLLTKLA